MKSNLFVDVSLGSEIVSVSPSGAKQYSVWTNDAYNDGGCILTIGTPVISEDGKTVTIPEKIQYGGHWLACGSSQGTVTNRNIVIKIK